MPKFPRTHPTLCHCRGEAFRQMISRLKAEIYSRNASPFKHIDENPKFISEMLCPINQVKIRDFVVAIHRERGEFHHRNNFPLNNPELGLKLDRLRLGMLGKLPIVVPGEQVD